MMQCCFKSDEILKKALPGQKVVFEGTVAEKWSSFMPVLNDCRLIDVEGETDVISLTTSDLDQGKKFNFGDDNGIVTGKVKSMARGKKFTSRIFIDLEAKESICVQLDLEKNPNASRIESLKAGDKIRVLGSRTAFAKREDYEGKIILYDCVLLD